MKTKERNKVILSVEDWELKQYCSNYTSGYKYYYLEHDCLLNAPNLYRGNQIEIRFYYTEFSKPCPTCGGLPSEGIQALYVFLADEMRIHDEA